MAICLSVSASEPQWPYLDAEEIGELNPQERAQLEADRAYAEKNYWQARQRYLELARGGEKFSQYRIAYMHEHGLGVEQDLAEAYAWAILAAELRDTALVDYKERLRERLDPGTESAGRRRVGELWSRYSAVAIAQRIMRENYRQLRSCTGSRLGTSCDTKRNIGSSISASGKEHRGDQVLYRQSVLQEIAELKEFVEEYWQSYGRVTLGEFEVIDEDVQDDD